MALFGLGLPMVSTDDGVRFTSWAPEGGEQVRGSYIFRLFGARDGSLYVGTDAGLVRITNGRVYNYPNSPPWPGPFAQDAQGTLWMGDFDAITNSRTLCRIGMESLACLGTEDGLDCTYGGAVMSDRAGSVWVGSRQGICHWQQNKTPENFLLPYLSRLGMGFGWVHALASTGPGTLWAGIPLEGMGYGLLTFSAGKWHSYLTREVDGTKLPVTSLLSDRHNSLWIGTQTKGLYRLCAGKLDRFEMQDGLSGNGVRATLEDREGDLWVVTDRGLDMFWDLPVISFTSHDGLPDEQASAITTQDDGTIWIGGKSALVRLKDQMFSSITRRDGLPKSGVDYLFRDHEDQLWVAGGEQLYLYKDKRFSRVSSGAHTNFGDVTSIAEDRSQQLWVGVMDGQTRKPFIVRVAALHAQQKYGMFIPTNGQFPNAMAADPNGGLWIGANEHGLFRFDDGVFRRVDAGGFDGSVAQMTVDPDGGLWVIAKLEGMFRYKGGVTHYLTHQNGLPCDQGYNIVDDHAGNHWFYMACGIVKISDSELVRWWNDPTHIVFTTYFSLADGAESEPSENPPVVGLDGRIWSVSDSPLRVIDPRNLPHNWIVPPVQVVKMIVDHKVYSSAGADRLPSTPREVEIDYSALSYTVPEKVMFRYKLTGYETSWTDAGTRRQAFYNDLRPGHYTFTVIACNNDGVWNRSGASVGFSIPPAWYQAIWFRSLGVVLLASLTYVLYRSRLRRYSALLRVRFDERIDERTRLARDLHDTLLQTLQGSKLVADNALEDPTDNVRMHKALDLVSRWLERATLEGRTALYSLRSSITETNDLAAALRDAAKNCCIGSNIQIDFVLNGTSSDMHPIVRDEIYRIGHEAINNACTHSGGSVVTIELTYSHDLHLCVRDDGKGLEEEIARLGRDRHFGLKGMRERADRIGAKLSLKTAANSGTELNLLVPGSVVFKTCNSQRRSSLAKLLRRS